MYGREVGPGLPISLLEEGMVCRRFGDFGSLENDGVERLPALEDHLFPQTAEHHGMRQLLQGYLVGQEGAGE